jgi:uncharacterized protein involved in outer membrane biogenesis
MILTEEQITAAYNTLSVAKANLSTKEMNYQDKKAIIDAEINLAIVGGQIEGKNAEERKAFTESKFTAQYDILRTLARASELSRLEYALAEIEVSRVNALLKLYVSLAAEVQHE